MSRKNPTPRQRVVALASLCLAAGGCAGLRLHQPARLDQASKASQHFDAAALDQTTAAERARLAEVLNGELELVRQHTLARRDARLLYVIGERGADQAWAFLDDEIRSRVGELGLTMDQLDQHLQNQAEADVFLEELLSLSDLWEAERPATPGLPVLSCPASGDFDSATLTDAQRVDFDAYVEICALYLDKRDGALESRPVNRRMIDDLRRARNEAKAAAARAAKAYQAAKKAYQKALAEPGDATEAEKSLVAAADKLARLAGEVGELAAVKDAERDLQPLGLDKVVADLSAVATGALVDAEQDAVLETISAALQTDAAQRWLAPKLQGEDDAISVATSLAALGSAVGTAAKPSLDSLLLEVEQLELDREAAKKRLAFFDRTLALLVGKEAAYRAELVHLAEAERLRREIEGLNGHDAACPRKVAGRDFFATPPVVDEGCRDRVFRMLVAYSNAWTLGRVEQELIDYRLIALHHEAALDSSEIAFARWQSLLSISIDQLVAFEETGLRAETLREIGALVGLGAVAVGVQ